jgi:hypothetical protein
VQIVKPSRCPQIRVVVRKFVLKVSANSRYLPSLFVVGVAGFEPATSWSQTMRADQLRYTPRGRM